MTTPTLTLLAAPPKGAQTAKGHAGAPSWPLAARREV